MKFSHALKFNANSAWKDHYINYNRLKKLIYKKEAEETKGLSLNFPDAANRTSIGRVPQPTLVSFLPLMCCPVQLSAAPAARYPSVVVCFACGVRLGCPSLFVQCSMGCRMITHL